MRKLKGKNAKPKAPKAEMEERAPYVIYGLNAFCMNGPGDLENTQLTLDEYIELKRHLSRLRH